MPSSLQPRDELGPDALEQLQIVGGAGRRRAPVGVDAEHLAGDVGGRGRDLVGDAVAFPRPDIGPVAAGDIGLVALARRRLDALACAAA